MAEVKDYLTGREVAGEVVIDEAIAARLDDYYAQWGVK